MSMLQFFNVSYLQGFLSTTRASEHVEHGHGFLKRLVFFSNSLRVQRSPTSNCCITTQCQVSRLVDGMIRNARSGLAGWNFRSSWSPSDLAIMTSEVLE